MTSPRVSILIPNYDNGRQSAVDGQRDFLGELLRSLERTLAGDPELLEILVADDGSNDDSLETAREWSRRRWPDGRPFLRLIELRHSGVLSSVLNRLMAEARGSIFARLDGDVVLRTPHWASSLAAHFDRDPRVGVITGVQLLSDGTVHAFGDDLWGPRGYRHIGRGARLADLPSEREVDHAMGCFYATRRAVLETAGGYDESVLRGQTEEYAVRVRRAGWKVLATKSIVFEHWHRERKSRANRADQPESLDRALDRFTALAGFDRLAPDLSVVRARYAGTPLWWRDHTEFGLPAARDEWERLTSDAGLAERIAEEFELAGVALRAASGACPVTQVGCGCGCLGLAVARAGGAYEGFEVVGPAADAAERAAGSLAGHLPGSFRCRSVSDLERLPLPDGSRPIVALFGVLERWWNPVGLLKECRRILAPGGVLLMRTRLRPTALDDPQERGHRFSAEEFVALLQHIGGLEISGFAPRASPSGWLECCIRREQVASGRGYFRPIAREEAERLPVEIGG